jgi:hypothetical protein
MKESVRDVITGELTLDYLLKRSADGWKCVSIEWSREAAAGAALESTKVLSEATVLPYGVRMAGTGVLEENPLEMTVLLVILEQIIREKRITEIARELNQQGYSTREGMPWGPAEVFNLLPRLIETGPSLLKSTAWQQRRSAPIRPV